MCACMRQRHRKALKKAFVSEQASVGLTENDQPKPSGNRKGNFKSQADPKRQKTEARVVCDFCGKGHYASEFRKKQGI